MGYVQHHAIIVTTWSKEMAENIVEKSALLFGKQATGVKTSINEYYTIFIGPDGSNEGWKDSDIGNQKREEFIFFLQKLKWVPDYVVVTYGGDLDNSEIQQDSLLNKKPEEDEEEQPNSKGIESPGKRISSGDH